jgi:hypothetical protein
MHIGLGMAQQPFSTSRISIFGQATDSQLGLLPLLFGHVHQQGLRGIGHALDLSHKLGHRHLVQMHRCQGHSIDYMGQTQQT